MNQDQTPPFGTKRAAALALYQPPFKFEHGYIFDSNNQMVADQDEVKASIAVRVRGWGRIGYMPNAAALQDEVGQVIAEALTAFWATPSMDYKKILLAYMNHVGDIEGTVFLGRSADEGIKGLTPNELAHLRELSEGKTEPCSLCKYDHGHMIGCENNPVDIALKKS